MRVNGIIAEYNPFHNGHKYHLEQSKLVTNADYNIVVLSSNFTQRGEPALLDKYLRARMALQGGADLVIELPLSHSAASAEYFAQGGISILDQLGIVDPCAPVKPTIPHIVMIPLSCLFRLILSH